MQVHYTYDQLIGMIATNNLAGIHARLVQEGRVSAMSVPSVDALKYSIQEQDSKLPTEQFLKWLENVLDVPLDQSALYYPELSGLRQSSGLSPATILVNQLRTEIPPQDEQTALSIFNDSGMTWVSWVLLILAIIGAVCVVRFSVRVIQKLTD